MKKEYTKPSLYAETFIMVEHIAGSCAIGNGATASFNENMAQEGRCKYNDNGLVLYRDAGSCGDLFNAMQYVYGDWSGYVAAMQNNTECYNAFNNKGNPFSS